MSKEIKVGDLVVVVRACCEEEYALMGGKVGVVRGFDPGLWRCEYCGLTSSIDPRVAAFNGPHSFSPLSWLKRIDPDILNTDIPEKEELLA
jgi:hypothetical protein